MKSTFHAWKCTYSEFYTRASPKCKYDSYSLSIYQRGLMMNSLTPYCLTPIKTQSSNLIVTGNNTGTVGK